MLTALGLFLPVWSSAFRFVDMIARVRRRGRENAV